jgi:hypothetical protein
MSIWNTVPLTLSQSGGIDLQVLGRALLALRQIEFVRAIGQACFLECDGSAQAIAGAGQIEIDHG